MNTREMTLEQIRQTGLAVLMRELGPVGMIRFLQQFETGHGDYSKDRHQCLQGRKVHDIAKDIRQRRKRP